MNQTLKTFYDNTNERETVKAFLIEMLREMAIERVFDGKSVVGIAESRELVDKAFDKLEELYGKVSEPININSR